MRFLILLVCLALLPPALSAAPVVPAPRTVELRIKHGDDPRWAARDWDDRDWPQIAPGEFPAQAGIYWVRFRLERSTRSAGRPVGEPFVWPRDEPGSPINSIFLSAVFAFELYWDGRFIGRSGIVGATRAAEIPGQVDHLMMIPEELLGPGPHVVALRMSSYQFNFPESNFSMQFVLENYLERLVFETRQPIAPLVGAGGAALVAVLCAALCWFVDRRRPLLLCSGVGFAMAVLYLLIAWRWLHNDPYDWLAPRYAMITGVMTLIAVLLPWLLLEQFAVPGRNWWLLILAPALAAAWMGPQYAWHKVVWMSRAMLFFSLVVAGWAVWQRRIGAWLALAGLLLGLVSVLPGGTLQAMLRTILPPSFFLTDARAILPRSFFLTFGALVLLLFTALGLQMREDRRRARDTALTAARLEVELLKKNLQPHFLLNTLAALTEIVEQDPRSAVKLIDDLADEFRSVARVSAEKLIPLAQELELCRAHLRVMSVRMGRAWSLGAPGVDEAALVPPAVFLTLIENGFAHQRVTGAAAAFRLTMDRAADGATRYTFFSPGDVQSDSTRPAGGTGLRYVQARCEESFPGRWSLRGESVVGGWQTVVEIRKNAEEGDA